MSDREVFKLARELRRHFDFHKIEREEYIRRLSDLKGELEDIKSFLERYPLIVSRLEELSKKAFIATLREIEENLSYALQDILGDDIRVKSQVETKRGKFWIQFYVEKDGYKEDILRGQGGAVCNILSVGLRLIALSQLEEKYHRRFIVLDEQDCWVRPDLVPRFMKIIYHIAEKLSYQVLVISHHDVDFFRDYADSIYRFIPDGEKMKVQRVPKRGL
ncbi:MAG: hypothetical protein N2260_03800 [Syntrophobacterales bacterium]|nr:hypothetical protein [Syntrophobacterales bacterium]